MVESYSWMYTSLCLCARDSCIPPMVTACRALAGQLIALRRYPPVVQGRCADEASGHGPDEAGIEPGDVGQIHAWVDVLDAARQGAEIGPMLIGDDRSAQTFFPDRKTADAERRGQIELRSVAMYHSTAAARSGVGHGDEGVIAVGRALSSPPVPK